MILSGVCGCAVTRPGPFCGVARAREPVDTEPSGEGYLCIVGNHFDRHAQEGMCQPDAACATPIDLCIGRNQPRCQEQVCSSPIIVVILEVIWGSMARLSTGLCML